MPFIIFVLFVIILVVGSVMAILTIKDIPNKERLPKIRKEILKAETKEKLFKLSDELHIILRRINSPSLKIITKEMLYLISDKLELEFEKKIEELS